MQIMQLTTLRNTSRNKRHPLSNSKIRKTESYLSHSIPSYTAPLRKRASTSTSPTTEHPLPIHNSSHLRHTPEHPTNASTSQHRKERHHEQERDASTIHSTRHGPLKLPAPYNSVVPTTSSTQESENTPDTLGPMPYHQTNTSPKTNTSTSDYVYINLKPQFSILNTSNKCL